MTVATILTILSGVIVLALTILEVLHAPSEISEQRLSSVMAIIFGAGIIIVAMLYRSEGIKNRSFGAAAISFTVVSFVRLYYYLGIITMSHLALLMVPFGLVGGVIAIMVGSKKRSTL